MAQANGDYTATAPLIESCAIPDMFCGELARIETIGPCSRLVFAVRQQGYPEGSVERVVVARVVVPTEILPAMCAALSGRQSGVVLSGELPAAGSLVN